MKTLIINCSPVKNGATAEIVKYISLYLNKEYEVRSICIDDYDIQFCKGCRSCHKTAQCVEKDDTIKIMEQFNWANKIIAVSPSYWADVPGQFKSFIDKCTPWCNTHEPHATIKAGKKGYVVALRTGTNMRECEKIFETIEHFYGHLEIESCGNIGLCSVECKEDALTKVDKIKKFCDSIFIKEQIKVK